jgi:membrane-associated phospholipid phosphatase
MLRLRFLLFFVLLYNISLSQGPYKLSWKKDAPIAAAGIAVGASSLYFLYQTTPVSIYEINGLSSSDINRFDRSAVNYYSPQISTVSDILVISSLALPAVLFADKAVRNDFFTIAAMYAETMLYAYSLPSICKGTVLRYRPGLYNPELSIDTKLDFGKEAKWSFFSGHTTAAFASVFFLAKVYSDYHPKSKANKFIYGGALITASTIGFLRYRAGKHFPTDIIAGAAVGAIIGYGIPALHKMKNKKLTILPVVSPVSAGLTMKF